MKNLIFFLFQHLNGIVGLTPKEIEILSENPVSLQGYLSSSSEDPSRGPSFSERDKHRTPLNRPSSLPGQRIHKVPVNVRSRTPIFIPSSAMYKQTGFGGTPSKYKGLRPNPHSSPEFHPSPHEMNPDDDLVLHQRFDSSSNTDDNDFYDNHDQSEQTVYEKC